MHWPLDSRVDLDLGPAWTPDPVVMAPFALDPITRACDVHAGRLERGCFPSYLGVVRAGTDGP